MQRNLAPIFSIITRNGVRWSVVFLLAAAGIAGCTKGVADVRFAAATTLSVTTAVGTAPMLAVSPGGTTAFAWVSAPDGGTDGRLYVQVDSGGITELHDALGPVEPHGESPPKLAYGPDGSLNAIYAVAKEVATARYPLTALRFVRSTTNGMTWSKPVTVTDDGDFGAHDFHALDIARDGTIYVSWLGGEGEQSTVWITHSTDGGATWSRRTPVDVGNACPCCRTALASAPDGTLYIAWRHVFPGNVRDIVVARSADQGQSWSAPIRVHADDWVFDGCPHAGPALQVDSAGRVHVAWWTGKANAAGVWYAHSDDRGVTFAAPVALGVANASRPAHVQLALGTGESIATVWDDGTLAVPRIVFRLSRDGGRTFGGPVMLSDAARSAGFPVVGASKSGVTIAWSEQTPAAAEAAIQTRPNMKDPHARMSIEPVGQAQVVVRRGVFE